MKFRMKADFTFEAENIDDAFKKVENHFWKMRTDNEQIDESIIEQGGMHIRPVEDFDGIKCSFCGASKKVYKHNLSIGLVETLKKVGLAIKTKGVNDIHLQKETDLTNNQYNNFQKLRYFGLVHHVKKNGKIMSGRWLITRTGWLFLRGDIRCRRWTKTFRNQIYEVPAGDNLIEAKFIFEFNKLDTREYYQKEFNFDIFKNELYEI
jgi:hypothetical protein